MPPDSSGDPPPGTGPLPEVLSGDGPEGAAADRPRSRATHRARRGPPLGVGHRRAPGGDPRRVPRWPFVLAGYLALSVGLLHDVWEDPGARAFGAGDAVLFTWYLGWVPHALAHGLDPLVVHAINAPDGANLTWSTPAPLLGVLAWPVTAAAGPVVAYNTVVTAAPALSGIALYAAARRWVSPGPAAVAGVVYAFSPYMVGASLGHPHLSFTVFPPLLLLAVRDVLAQHRRASVVGPLLGLGVAAQAMVSEEVLATSALVGALALVILAVGNPRSVRRAVGPLAAALGWCALVAAVLLAYPLWVQFAGPHRVHGAVQARGVAVSDLFTFVVPTGAQWLAPGAALRFSDRFTGTAVEVSGYLGVPLLVLLVFVTVRLRREPLVRVMAPLFVVVALLSLGPRLHHGGWVHRRVPLPWAALQSVPLVDNALPSRLALYLTLATGLLLALWLERARAGAVRAGAALATAVALVPLFPAPLHAGAARVPEFFSSGAARVIPEGSTVLVAPYPRPALPAAMLWQASAGYRFDLPGCYCTVAGRDGRARFDGASSALTTALLRVEAGTASPAQALALPGLGDAFTALRPDAVVVGPSRNHDALVEFVTALTGRAPVQEPGGVALWALAFGR